MLQAFFEKLEKSKWMPRIGTALFALPVVAMIFGGESLRGLGFLIFFSSFFVGAQLGSKLAFAIATYVLKTTEDMSKRLSVASGVFGLFLTPSLVVSYTNANFDTDIGTSPLIFSLLGACMAAGFAFWLADIGPKDRS